MISRHKAGAAYGRKTPTTQLQGGQGQQVSANRMDFDVIHSSFCILHSTFSILQSPFFILRSSFSILHSPFLVIQFILPSFPAAPLPTCVYSWLLFLFAACPHSSQ